MNYYRQGDLAITPIKRLPKGLKKVKSNVLAYGEATGHKHRLLEILPQTENQFEILEDDKGNKYLDIKHPTDLVHEEHKKLTIDRGLYFIKNEKEYNYFEEETARVID